MSEGKASNDGDGRSRRGDKESGLRFWRRKRRRQSGGSVRGGDFGGGIRQWRSGGRIGRGIREVGQEF